MYSRSIEVYNEKKAAIAKGDEGVKRMFREGKDLMSILRTYSYSWPLRSYGTDGDYSSSCSEGQHDCGGRGPIVGRRTDWPNVVSARTPSQGADD